MTFEDKPLEEVMVKPAKDVDMLLKVRAWEVKESPLDLGYVAVKTWPKLPPEWRMRDVAGVAVDSKGRYYVYHRAVGRFAGAPPFICFDRSGKPLRSWGEEAYVHPHMCKCDENDNIWLIDDGGHVLYLYSPEGRLLKTLGTKGVPGADATHFNKPTDIAFGLNGRLYVSDGYGNRRVAYFDQDLKFLGQWGSEGEGEGQFVLPHSITTDPDGLVYVADRTKWRIQIFSPDGKFLRQWTHIGRPSGITYASDGYIYVVDHHNFRVNKVDLSGTVIGFFGRPGHYFGGLSEAMSIAVAPNLDILLAHRDDRAQLFSLE